MKRFFLSLLISIIAIGAFAQKGKVASTLNFIDAGTFDKAKEAIDAAIVHEKTKEWPKTYYAKGRLAQALYETDDPAKQALYPEPLMLAYTSYLKSIELDEKESMQKLVILQLPQLSNDFLEWAIAEFEAEEFVKSLIAFEKLIEIQKSDIYIGSVDSAVIFNAGLSAYNAKLWDKAIDYFDQGISMAYGKTQPYLFKYLTYNEMGDMENAEKALTDAFEAFPADQNILLNLIQFYLENEMDDAAFDYINMAKESDQNNYSLFWAEGILYLKQDKFDEAIIALKKSIEIKPDFFNTQYNIGVCYYNKASNMFNEANDIMDNAEYKEATDKAYKVFGDAIPYMETAHDLNPDDLETLISLKELYYRLKMTEKYDVVVAKINELENK
ncbi:MAG: tetratricopeptide repeat protein [Bacteroidales bacterium]|nr:tetratricopeptide repeat protein [Bacteroidales bacterium]